jgi:dipeptidyl aminopeptidase/acylaminoacyl peptidase
MVEKESPDEPTGIFLLSLETGKKTRLTSPPADHLGDAYPQFSPDGRTVAFARHKSSGQSSKNGIYLVPAEGGEPRPLVTGNIFTAGLDWTPEGREILFSAGGSGGLSLFALWRVPVVGGEPESLPVGEEGFSPTLSRQRALMSYSKGSGTMDLWRVGGPFAGDKGRPPARFISTSTWAAFNEFPGYSPDGGRIAFGSRRSGFPEVWICERDGSNQTQLTHFESKSHPGSWSPDGRRLVISSHAEGNWDIYVTDVTGGVSRRLTDHDSDDDKPSWSRDGRWIYFRSHRNGRSFELYRMPADGGEAVQLTTAGGCFGIESPDGRSLFFTKREPLRDRHPRGIWRIPVEGGEEVKVHDRGVGTSWVVLDEGICYLNVESDTPTVEFLDFSSGEVRWVVEVEDAKEWGGLAVSPDGLWVVYLRQVFESDIMLVENFR